MKEITGLGTTIDVILVNGLIRESDTMIVPGTEGPIVTQIRGLLMPKPLRELRVKVSCPFLWSELCFENGCMDIDGRVLPQIHVERRLSFEPWIANGRRL